MHGRSASYPRFRQAELSRSHRCDSSAAPSEKGSRGAPSSQNPGHADDVPVRFLQKEGKRIRVVQQQTRRSPAPTTCTGAPAASRSADLSLGVSR